MASTVSITWPASSTGIDRDAVNAIRAMIAVPAIRAPAGLADAVTGPAAVNAGTSGQPADRTAAHSADHRGGHLVLVYRSPVLWLLPLAGAVSAVIVARASSHGLANAGLTVSALSSDIVIVLVFGAASDYALLLVHWYREELRHRAATEAAMAVAPGRSTSTRSAPSRRLSRRRRSKRDATRSRSTCSSGSTSPGLPRRGPSSTTSGESPARPDSGTSLSSRCVPTTPSTRPSPRPSRSSIVLIDEARHHLCGLHEELDDRQRGSRRARFRAVLHQLPQRRRRESETTN
jgi:hypothetical protein